MITTWKNAPFRFQVVLFQQANKLNSQVDLGESCVFFASLEKHYLSVNFEKVQVIKKA